MGHRRLYVGFAALGVLGLRTWKACSKATGSATGEHLRPWMSQRFVEALAATGRPWRLLTGSAAGRTATAVAAIDQLCARLSGYTDPSCPPLPPRAADARAR